MQTMESRERFSPPPYRFAALHLITNPLPRFVDPTCYLKASGETLALMFVLCWTATLLVAPDTIAANPLNDRLGYYTLCVGLDSFPGNSIGLVLFVPAAYFGLRFVWTDTMRAVLEREQLTKTQYWFSLSTNGAYMLSISLFALVFVHSPFENHYAHTTFFAQLIVFRFLVVSANYFKAPEVARGSMVFLILYGIISLVLPLVYFVDFYWYEEDGSVVIPWQIVAALDYGWFACLALTTKFLPQAPYITATWDLKRT